MHQLLMPAVRNCGAAVSFVISFFVFLTVIVWASSGRVHFPRFWADPSFVGLVVAFKWICGVFKFLFEEFVNVIFPSFSWSPDRSVGPVSCAQFRVPVSSLSWSSVAK